METPAQRDRRLKAERQERLYAEAIADKRTPLAKVIPLGLERMKRRGR